MKFLSSATCVPIISVCIKLILLTIILVFCLPIFPEEPEPCECGTKKGKSVTSRVVGGEDTEPYEFPWLTFLVVTKRTTPDKSIVACGASIISDSIVLTAAHCVFNDADKSDKKLLPPENIRVIFHTYRPRNETRTYDDASKDKPFYEFKLKKVIPHPKYSLDNTTYGEDDQYLNDLALLVLEKKVDIKKPIFNPVCLPKKNDKITLFPGKFATVAGWGRTSRNPPGKADKSQKLQIPLQSDELCAKVVPNKKLSKFICGDAGDETGSAPGDSGGPLVIELPSKHLLQIGIVSHGKDDITVTPTNQFSRMAFYTKITEYIDWIEKESAPYGPKTCERKSNPT